MGPMGCAEVSVGPDGCGAVAYYVGFDVGRGMLREKSQISDFIKEGARV